MLLELFVCRMELTARCPRNQMQDGTWKQLLLSLVFYLSFASRPLRKTERLLFDPIPRVFFLQSTCLHSVSCRYHSSPEFTSAGSFEKALGTTSLFCTWLKQLHFPRLVLGAHRLRQTTRTESRPIIDHRRGLPTRTVQRVGGQPVVVQDG
jgi:hypothetical protein